ncbi:TasA family protein [Aneurinibacillus sp. REN35]|uniref:TasA family protein n=1 Tax=Aneurinibacillus sp. REN35 TaxID=3237286 RepID=UPI0035290798
MSECTMRRARMRLFCLLLCAVWMTGSFGIEPVRAENITVDIGLSPAEVFMNVKNIKPGDTVTSTLTVKNNGNTEITYVSGAEFASGREDFYRLLTLKVEEGGQPLYEGLLNRFAGFPMSKLRPGEEKALQVTIGFPYEAGNEYQGASAVYLFVFAATAGTKPDHPAEPPTGGDGDSGSDRGSDSPSTVDDSSTKPDLIEETRITDRPIIPPTDTPQITEIKTPTPATPDLPPQTGVKNPPAAATGIPLPDTASPWFNILLLSVGAMMISSFSLWRAGRPK